MLLPLTQRSSFCSAANWTPGLQTGVSPGNEGQRESRSRQIFSREVSGASLTLPARELQPRSIFSLLGPDLHAPRAPFLFCA